jgi:thiol-disulfide isomerase/thioredoxin
MLAGMLGFVMLTQRPAPDAVCLDLKNQQVMPLQRSQNPAPKATVLIFYLAHCPISQKLTPEINRVYKEFSGKGVKFYMVHEDLTLTNREVATEAKTYALLPPVIIDKWRTQQKLSNVHISPEAVVYDSQFRLRYSGRISDLFYDLGKMRQKTTSRDLRDAVADVLAGKEFAMRKTEAVGCILPKS